MLVSELSLGNVVIMDNLSSHNPHLSILSPAIVRAVSSFGIAAGPLAQAQSFPVRPAGLAAQKSVDPNVSKVRRKPFFVRTVQCTAVNCPACNPTSFKSLLHHSFNASHDGGGKTQILSTE